MNALAAAPVSGAFEFGDQFVAAFGKDAALGCFAAAQASSFSRRERVLVKTPRGLEIGEILGPATLRQARLLGAQAQGDIVRPLTSTDEATVRRMHELAGELLAQSERLLLETNSELSLIDAEVFFDLRHALLHILHPNPDDLATFVETLCERTGLIVRLANLAIAPEPEPQHGCDKPDCGSGGGGCTSCSTGGCSTGCGTGSTAAPDLRPYFAHLRDQMETSQRIPLA